VAVCAVYPFSKSFKPLNVSLIQYNGQCFSLLPMDAASSRQLFWEVGVGVLCDGFLKYSPRNFCHADYRWYYITGTLGNPKKPSAGILTEDILLRFVNYITLYWQDFQVLSVYGTCVRQHTQTTHTCAWVELHLSRHWLSRLPVIEDQLGPLSKFVENSTKQLAFKLLVIVSSIVQCYGFPYFKSGVVNWFRRRCIL
jgi:hypothetical protein